ncbi:uncharacterized protein LOC131186255 isoform X1 [Ahaetulla prasina]|uniref:uncharacterized protein LOC131186255 isoform X1 n=1 Tax=Ahaetulla prasina TaxID=499056 RepID=UPI0026485660|nr:uncharacterized protein LOC131186255 isoform X1 [Ahaetulla prasina]
MQRSESAYGAPSVLAGLGPCCNDAPAGNFSSSRAQEGDKESGWDSRASSNTPRSGGCQQLSVRKYQTQQLTNKPIHLAPRLGKNHQAEIPTEVCVCPKVKMEPTAGRYPLFVSIYCGCHLFFFLTVLSGMPQSKENALELQSMAATGKVLFLGILCQKEGKCRGGKEAEDKSRFAQGDGDENPGCRFQEEGQTGLPGGMPKAAPREAGGTKENNYL